MLIKELLEKYDDEAIVGEIKRVLTLQEADYLSENDRTVNFSGFGKVIRHLRTLEPTDAEDFSVFLSSHPGEGCDGEPKEFIHVNGHTDADPDETYALEFRPWPMWLAMKIADESLAMFGPLTCLAHILTEMTWVSDNPEEISEQLKELQRRSAEVEAGTAETYPMEEVFERARKLLDGIEEPEDQN